IFTPATKAPRGEHDENIPAAAVAGLVGADTAAELQRITLEVYRRGAAIAASGGIVVADTKIELGRDAQGRLLLADRVLTPHSSRFWPAGEWRPGPPQPSFAHQFLPDSLDSPHPRLDPPPTP